MEIKTMGKAVELLNNSLPYPEQMKDIDLENKSHAYFTWRGDRYRLYIKYCRVEKVDGNMLIGDSASLLMSELIKRELIKEL